MWGTKYRRKFLNPYVTAHLLESLYDTVKAYPTLHLEAVNADEDHVHLQIEIPPNLSIATAVQVLKARSSIHLRCTFAFIRDMYPEGGV